MDKENDQEKILAEIKQLIFDRKDLKIDEIIRKIRKLVWDVWDDANSNSYELNDDLDEIWSILNDYETENYWPEEHFDMIKEIFEKKSVRL